MHLRKAKERRKKSSVSLTIGRFCPGIILPRVYVYTYSVSFKMRRWKWHCSLLYEVPPAQSEPCCSWRYQPSRCVFERPSLHLCVLVRRGWSLLITQHVLAFASSWMCAVCCFCLACWVVIHYMLLKSDNLRKPSWLSVGHWAQPDNRRIANMGSNISL